MPSCLWPGTNLKDPETHETPFGWICARLNESVVGSPGYNLLIEFTLLWMAWRTTCDLGRTSRYGPIKHWKYPVEQRQLPVAEDTGIIPQARCSGVDKSSIDVATWLKPWSQKLRTQNETSSSLRVSEKSNGISRIQISLNWCFRFLWRWLTGQGLSSGQLVLRTLR